MVDSAAEKNEIEWSLEVDSSVSSVADPTVSIQQPPEPSKGRGRKPGQTPRHTKLAVVRLAELGFDPIEKLVELYTKISAEIEEMNFLKANPQVLKNGDVRRYSSMAHAALLTTQQKLINDLMRYGYARVPETVNIKPDVPLGMTINLTPKGGKFSADDVIDIVENDDDNED